MLNQPSVQGRILIVDDEEKITSILSDYLSQEGFDVQVASNGQEALLFIHEQTDISLVLLDWMMPEINGPEVFRRIRALSDVPVIFLTAKTDEIDKLLLLELGADDYITKPFSIREIATRIRVVLRRYHKYNHSLIQNGDSNELLNRGSVTIDLSKRAVYKEGTELVLTPTEYKLLVKLATSPGRVYSRLQLLEDALGEEYAGYERSIDTHISNLRKKIEEDSTNPTIILTIFGVGYRFGETR